MNDYILSRIERYLREKFLKPVCFYSEVDFRVRSYTRETAMIILDRISDHPFCEAEDTLWQFQMEIEYCCWAAQDSNSLSIFQVMRNTAEEIARLITN